MSGLFHSLMLLVTEVRFMTSCIVILDMEDVLNAVGDLFSVESANQIFTFTNASEFQDLVDHIN